MKPDTPTTLSLTQHGTKIAIEEPTSDINIAAFCDLFITLMKASDYSLERLFEEMKEACEEQITILTKP